MTRALHLEATSITAGELREGDPLIERLPFAGEALENLARLAGRDPAVFADEIAWSAAVTIDGTTVFVRSDGEHWAILAPPDAVPGEAMQAARRLHGALGEKTSDWDQDR